MRRSSSSFVAASYLDRSERIAALEEAARRAAGCVPEIKRVILFGSLVSGIPTPRSDADLLVEVSSSPHRQPRDRIPEMLLALRPLPCPLDLFVLTSEELERFRPDSPLLRAALQHGMRLL